MTIKPGGHDDVSQGWTGGWATRSNTTGAVYLNCEFVVLDFGTSTLMHGSLEQEVQLDDQFIEGTAPYKDCPECGADVPVAVKESSPWAMYVKVFLPL